MRELAFTENELSGARVTVPFTALQHLGPKHHAIVIGLNDEDQEIWIAELSRRHGYRLVSLKQWLSDNGKFLEGMKIEPNAGPRLNWEVAKSAIDEVLAADANRRKYDVIFNNCETFANRHLNGDSSLSPQVKKAAKLLGFAVVGGALILKRHLQQQSGSSST